MKILINGKEFTKDEMDAWKRKRVTKALRNLKKTLPMTKDTEALCNSLALLKSKLSYEEITSPLKVKLAVGQAGMKLAAAFSRGKRRAAVTVIFSDGITAELLRKIIDALLLQDTPEYRRVNLAACPDHYVLRTCGQTLEVIETTGNTPVPTQFFITFNDETGLKEARDLSYPYQSTGIAKLKDGTIIGGVRHQFRDTPSGIEVRTLVEFPILCPKIILKEHQKHLAVEWSNWITWAIQNQARFPVSK